MWWGSGFCRAINVRRSAGSVPRPLRGRRNSRGNAGKWVIRGLGAFDFTAFALKDVRVLESLKLQFRLEAFNAFNHMYFDGINTQLGSRAFGQVDGTGAQRYIQLGAKLIW